MYLHWLVFALASIGWMCDAANCSNEDYVLAYDALFNYLDLGNIQNSQKRPLVSETYTVILVDLFVTSITEVNEKAQSFTTQIKMNTIWINRKMSWNRGEFCNISTYTVKKDMLWTPDIVISESIKTEFGTKDTPYVQLSHYGLLVLSDIFSLTTACKLDLYRFPFDIQSCEITLFSAGYSNEEIILETFNSEEWLTQGSKETFQAQGEWELLSIKTTKSVYFILWDLKGTLIYQITIKRRPLLYVINFILPVFFFLVLDVTSFFMDASGADKLSFKVTLLLSISVLLLILNDTLPSTADKLPLIGIYCSAIFSLIGISILETILVNFLMSKGNERKSTGTTAIVPGQDDGVVDLQITPDSVRDQSSLCWIRLARITDTIFLILYIITIIVFLSVLGRVWIIH